MINYVEDDEYLAKICFIIMDTQLEVVDKIIGAAPKVQQPSITGPEKKSGIVGGHIVKEMYICYIKSNYERFLWWLEIK